jgi:predicted HTH transcriptional regulator
MEERGTGIRRMRNAMLDHGLDAPQVALDDDSFVLTLPGPADDLSRIRTPEATDLSLPPSVTDELNKRQIRIAQRLVSGENLSSAELQKDFQVTRDTIARDMSLLIELKLAQKTGQARATRYIHGSANRQVSSDEI